MIIKFKSADKIFYGITFDHGLQKNYCTVNIKYTSTNIQEVLEEHAINDVFANIYYDSILSVFESHDIEQIIKENPEVLIWSNSLKFYKI